MAKIQEELVLYDRFTQTFTRYIRLGEQAAGVTGQAKDATEQFARSQRTAERAAGSLTGAVRQLAGAYAGLRGAAALVGLSDQMAQTTARLDRMNDGLQTTAQLQDMIWQSAQRSRGLYADTAAFVSKLGTLAGDAFSSTAEIVAFAEQINKQLVLSGASTAEAQGALLQLTQGLSSGALRGEELNSVLEQTPMIARTIAGYMGVTTGEMRELASEGKVTAAVVKNAMLSAAEETDAAFEKMPMTWGQVWSSFQNTAIVALQPVLDGVNLLANHMDIVGPIVLGAGAAFAVFVVAANWMNICAAATNALAAAQTMLGAVMATAWGPVLIVVALVVAAIYAVTAAVNEFTGASVSATGLIAGAVAAALAFVGNLFIAAANTALGAFTLVWNGVAAFADFLGNVFTDPIGSIARLFFDLADTVLGVLETIARAVDTLFGSDLAGAVSGWRGSLSGWVDSTFGRGKEIMAKADFTPLERLDYGNAWNAGYGWGAGLFSSDAQSGQQSPFTAYDDIATQLSGIGGDVSSIKKSVDLSKEDIKSLVDVAERRYVNNINLTAQTPIVTVNGANTGRTAADRRDLANAIRDILLEQRAAGGVRATSLPVQG